MHPLAVLLLVSVCVSATSVASATPTFVCVPEASSCAGYFPGDPCTPPHSRGAEVIGVFTPVGGAADYRSCKVEPDGSVSRENGTAAGVFDPTTGHTILFVGWIDASSSAGEFCFVGVQVANSGEAVECPADQGPPFVPLP